MAKDQQAQTPKKPELDIQQAEKKTYERLPVTEPIVQEWDKFLLEARAAFAKNHPGDYVFGLSCYVAAPKTPIITTIKHAHQTEIVR